MQKKEYEFVVILVIVLSVMKQQFENLEIWKLSFELWKELAIIFYDGWFRNYSFQDQIMRASISISNNIAEWNDRWSAKDFIKFLTIAKSSAAEVRNMIYFAFELKYISIEQKESFLLKLTTISVKIANLIHYLKQRIETKV